MIFVGRILRAAVYAANGWPQGMDFLVSAQKDSYGPIKEATLIIVLGKNQWPFVEGYKQIIFLVFTE